MSSCPSIFSDDLAKDIESAFKHSILNDASVGGATRYVLELFGTAAERFDKTNLLYLRLASLQVEHGCVTNDVKKKALAIIDAGQVQGPKRRKEDRIYFGHSEVLSELKENLLKSAVQEN